MANTKSFESPVRNPNIPYLDSVRGLVSRTFLKGETIDPSALGAVCVLKSGLNGAVEEWFVSEDNGKEYLSFTHRGGDFFGLEQVLTFPDAPPDSKTFFRVGQDAEILLLKKEAVASLPEQAQTQLLAAFLKTAHLQRVHAVRRSSFYVVQAREHAQGIRDLRTLCAKQEENLRVKEEEKERLRVENTKLKKTLQDLRMIYRELQEWKARTKKVVRKVSLRVDLP